MASLDERFLKMEKPMQRVLITGAAGRLGKVLRTGLSSNDRVLRLLDIVSLGEAGEREEIVCCDATDMESVLEAMEDVDVVLHLAAYPEEAPWETIFPLNYNLTYTVFEAARRSGIKRVVFASSVQAVGFHPISEKIDDGARLRPSGYYGVSKAFGEALASLYADKHGISFVCVRVASFEAEPTDTRMLSTWLSHEDGVHLFDRCLRAPEHHFFTVYGVSNNTRSQVDNAHVNWLGYNPISNAEDFAEKVMSNGDELGPLAAKTHGGGACDVGFDADIMRSLHAK
ncbi:NAD(P)-dependent oxidoreductase [Roseovarius aestuarii]|nr:NAD(P)-dependent oxidoreductase [Roseovarius aestuarii]